MPLSRSSPLQEKYAEIDRLKGQFHIHALCRVLDVHRSSFYHYQNRSPEKTQIELADEFFAPRIKKLFEQSNERFGSRKIQALLRREGLVISMRRISRLMADIRKLLLSVTKQYLISVYLKTDSSVSLYK